MVAIPFQAPAASAPRIVQPTMPQLTVVRLANEGNETFDRKYGPTQRVVIPPGESVFVHEEVAWHYLGRWFTDNANPRQRRRQQEVERLRVFYGAYEDELAWQRNKPQIVAYTPSGDRITTVVDDPDGTISQLAQTPLSLEQAQQAQIDYLMAQVAALQGGQDQIRSRREAEEQGNAEVDGAATAVPPPVAATVEVGGMNVPVVPHTVVTQTIAPPPIPWRAVDSGVEVSLPPRDGILSSVPEVVDLSASVDNIPTDEPAGVLVGPSAFQGSDE